MNSSTISFLTLSLLTVGVVLKYRQDVDWVAVVVISIFLLCVGALTTLVVYISRARANYSKYLRQDLIASLRFPDGLTCLDRDGRIGFTQDVPRTELIRKFEKYKTAKPGLTKCYVAAIVVVTLLAIASVIFASANRQQDNEKTLHGAPFDAATPRQ